MQLFAWTTIISLVVSIGVLTSWVRDPDADLAERNVHTTLLSTLAGGTAINIACAVLSRAVGAVPPGDELGACTPYGLMGGGIAARLHMHYINGYVHGEWAYVKQTPARVVGYGRAARSLVEVELKKLGLLQSDEAPRKSEL